MFTIDAFYHQNIKPIIKDEILDYLDLGNKDCPNFDDLGIDSQQDLASLLFFNDSNNFDPISDLDIKFAIKRMMTATNSEPMEDLACLISDKVTSYYKNTINEILEFEFEEIYNEHQEGLCEAYKYDQEC